MPSLRQFLVTFGIVVVSLAIINRVPQIKAITG